MDVTKLGLNVSIEDLSKYIVLNYLNMNVQNDQAFVQKEQLQKWGNHKRANAIISNGLTNVLGGLAHLSGAKEQPSLLEAMMQLAQSQKTPVETGESETNKLLKQMVTGLQKNDARLRQLVEKLE